MALSSSRTKSGFGVTGAAELLCPRNAPMDGTVLSVRLMADKLRSGFGEGPIISFKSPRDEPEDCCMGWGIDCGL